MLSHMMDSAFLFYSANSVLKFVVINCLYSSFRLIGRKDMSINSFRSGWAFWNRLNRLAIVLVPFSFSISPLFYCSYFVVK